MMNLRFRGSLAAGSLTAYPISYYQRIHPVPAPAALSPRGNFIPAAGALTRSSAHPVNQRSPEGYTKKKQNHIHLSFSPILYWLLTYLLKASSARTS